MSLIDFDKLERETVRKVFIHVPTEHLEMIQEVANAILNDRAATLDRADDFEDLDGPDGPHARPTV